jgi:hypothetical protein
MSPLPSHEGFPAQSRLAARLHGDSSAFLEIPAHQTQLGTVVGRSVGFRERTCQVDLLVGFVNDCFQGSARSCGGFAVGRPYASGITSKMGHALPDPILDRNVLCTVATNPRTRADTRTDAYDANCCSSRQRWVHRPSLTDAVRPRPHHTWPSRHGRQTRRRAPSPSDPTLENKTARSRRGADRGLSLCRSSLYLCSH